MADILSQEEIDALLGALSSGELKAEDAREEASEKNSKVKAYDFFRPSKFSKEQIRTIYDNYGFETEILAASIRGANHVSEAALAGADIATCPPSVLKSLAAHPLTDKGLEAFMADWAKTGQKIA